MSKQPDGIATFCKVCNKPIHLWYNDWENQERRKQIKERLCKEHMGWISVKDSLPEEGIRILVLVDSEACLGYYKGNLWEVQPFYMPNWETGFAVTHWASIPKIPERENLMLTKNLESQIAEMGKKLDRVIELLELMLSVQVPRRVWTTSTEDCQCDDKCCDK